MRLVRPARGKSKTLISSGTLEGVLDLMEDACEGLLGQVKDGKLS